jgi:ribosomal protein L4
MQEKALIITADKDERLELSSRNVPGVKSFAQGPECL